MIKKNNKIIDDCENNLDIAKEYKLIPLRMNRNRDSTSKYPIIHNLTDLK